MPDEDKNTSSENDLLTYPGGDSSQASNKQLKRNLSLGLAWS